MSLHTAHAFAATARKGFDDDGIPDFVGLLFEEFRLLQFAVIAGYDGHARLLHQRFGMMFEAHGTYSCRRRPDKRYARFETGLGEIDVFRQKTVAGMDALSLRLLGCCNKLIDHKIAFGCRCRPDRIRFVALPNVKRSCIRLGIDRDGAYPHPARGPGDAAGNFAAIGNQD